ncbi:hypothetical protein [Halalkalicoccus ordinarius]|uniref:hypothetical protein n=1 Tax=Halalkalicoccus ordinarius TaxID=3116651 RepID=UPI00300F201A
MSADTPTETDSETDVDTDTDADDTAADPSPAAEIEADRRRSRATVAIGLLGLAIVGAGFWMAAETVGLVAAAGVGLAWYLLSSPYAIAFGHAALLPFVSAVALRPDLLRPELLVAELGLVVLLVAPAAGSDRPLSFVLMTVPILAGLLLVGLGGYWLSADLRIAAGALVGTIVVAGYALYRYELVRLGLVDTEEGEPA